jgi:hypothetical protein
MFSTTFPQMFGTIYGRFSRLVNIATHHGASIHMVRQIGKASGFGAKPPVMWARMKEEKRMS